MQNLVRAIVMNDEKDSRVREVELALAGLEAAEKRISPLQKKNTLVPAAWAMLIGSFYLSDGPMVLLAMIRNGIRFVDDVRPPREMNFLYCVEAIIGFCMFGTSIVMAAYLLKNTVKSMKLHGLIILILATAMVLYWIFNRDDLLFLTSPWPF